MGFGCCLRWTIKPPFESGRSFFSECVNDFVIDDDRDGDDVNNDVDAKYTVTFTCACDSSLSVQKNNLKSKLDAVSVCIYNICIYLYVYEF